MTTDAMTDVAALQMLGPRERQEDAALHVRHGSGRLLVVADGMGGEPAGDVASRSAVLGFEKGFGVPPEEPEDNMRWASRFMDGLRGAMDAMQGALAKGEGKNGMATTLAAVWVDPNGIRWLNVGDSSIWVGDGFQSIPPKRLNRLQGQGHAVDSALIANTGPFRAPSLAADCCLAQIEMHPAASRVGSGDLIVVATDGLDVLERPGGWIDRELRRMPKEWTEAFQSLNPGDFLARVKSALDGGTASDNTTAIALRRPVSSPFIASSSYVPVSGAPDRELLTGDSS